MSAPSQFLEVYLDLGDALTKGICEGRDGPRRFRYPSVVARRWMDGDRTGLSLGEEAWPAPVGFEPARYPRTRSYPGTARVLDAARPVPGARFAGWLATKYGADRQLLGAHPTPENVETLVRKALLSVKADRGRVRITFVVDSGAKARTVIDHGRAPRRVEMTAWKLGREEPRRIALEVEHRVVDAAACVAATLPAHLSPTAGRRVLLLDVGYLRSKLAVLSAEGCELQVDLPGLGVASCVRRLLRDGRERGLVEDELAVVRALERSRRTLEIGGRRFEVGAHLEDARRDLEEELGRAVRRAVLEHYGRRGEPCRAVAIVGGGAALVGAQLGASLERADLGIGATWVTADAGFEPVEGARRIHGRGASPAEEREDNRV